MDDEAAMHEKIIFLDSVQIMDDANDAKYVVCSYFNFSNY